MSAQGRSYVFPPALRSASGGCLADELRVPDLGLATLLPGTYQVQLPGGPDLTPLSAPTDLNVGRTRQPAAHPGGSSPSSTPSSSASTSN
ncbi:MAG: hypothetical protein M3Y33_17765 [Actinomycetota bacterium]|nr:hypothetical protein [Actinomycetota bacterium]